MNKELYEYVLRMGDDSLILGQRLGEWCGHGPILEEDIALTNVALDILGQARILMDYAGKLTNKKEDEVAFLREEWDYKNVLLVEQPNGDFAKTILRQFFFDAFRLPFFKELQNSKDETLSGLALKAVKETTYHLQHSSNWVIRLGDGTDESHQRLKTALEELWMFAGELFYADEVDTKLVNEGIAVDLNKIKPIWDAKVSEVFAQAKLQIPEESWMQKGGREGKHTEHLGFLLSEMQYMQRAYPGCEW